MLAGGFILQTIKNIMTIIGCLVELLNHGSACLKSESTTGCASHPARAHVAQLKIVRRACVAGEFYAL
jgi:hypothetical protein